MTESEADNMATEPRGDVSDSDARHPNPSKLLRRTVLWVGVIASLFAVGCALGVYFTVRYYNFISDQSPVLMQARSVRLALIGIVEKCVMTCAFIYLARALFRYAGALQRARQEGAAEAADPLLRRQLSCWQAAIWVAWLYIGWELTAAIVGASW